MKYLHFPPHNDLASLALRIFLGLMFFLHGIGKLVLIGMDTVVSNFITRGLPIWTAYGSTSFEIIFGLMILAGVYTRLAVLALLPVSIGILFYHFQFGWVFHNQGGGYEYPQLIFTSLITLFLLGGGKYSLVQSKQ